MNRSILYGLAGNSNRRRGLLGLVALVCIGLLVVFSLEVKQQLRLLGYAASDNVLWVFSRGEIEANAFELTLKSEAADPEPDLAEVRLKFDILYSRVRTLRESDVVDPLREDPHFSANLRIATQRMESMIPWIDADDETLRAALPKLAELSEDTTQALLELSHSAVTLYSKISDSRRESISLTLQMIGAATSALFLLLLIMLYILSRLLRGQEQSAEALTKARDRAIEGEQAKAHMLAVMSHEMRTPLNGVVGALDLVDTAALPQDQKTYVDTARNSAGQLVGHVDDVLAISRLDAGQLKSKPKPFDLVALLEDTVESLRHSAQARGNALIIRPPHPDLHDCFGDAGRIQQVLLNYIGNAIKFTTNGTITIEADCSVGLEDVEIRISDTGIGIHEVDLDRIFIDFVTLDIGYDRTNAGTGLGLGIVRRLAKALGGTVGAESEKGQGSVFWLRVPLHRNQTAAQPEEQPPSVEPTTLPKLNILIVEDNEANRLILHSLLVRMGHKVQVATNGHEGVEAARQAAFDVILMDISMPKLDGLSAARILRSDSSSTAQVPIIATTAHALPDERIAFEQAGMQGILTKPLSTESLRRALSRAVSGQSKQIALEAPPANQVGVSEEQIETLIQNMEPDKLASSLTLFFGEMSRFSEEALGATMNVEQAHRMAGSAALFGATDLADHLRAMCESGKLNQPAVWKSQAKELQALWSSTRTAYLSTDLPQIQKIAHGQF